MQRLKTRRIAGLAGKTCQCLLYRASERGLVRAFDEPLFQLGCTLACGVRSGFVKRGEFAGETS